MKNMEKKKNEEERRERVIKCDQDIYGLYFEKVQKVLEKIKSNSGSFSYGGLSCGDSFFGTRKVIGVSKTQNGEPKLVFIGCKSLPFSEVDFSSI